MSQTGYAPSGPPPAPWNQQGAPHDMQMQQMPPRPPRWQYKVLTQKDRWFSGKFDPERLEQALNSYAQEGWQVVSTATATIPGSFSSNREEMIFVLGRVV